MRLAIFCNDYWPIIGGVQTAVRGLAAGLGARGHRVLILTRQPGRAPVEEMVDDALVHRFEWNLAPAVSFLPRALKARRSVREVVRAWGAEAMYAHFVSVHALFAWDCARLAHAPLVLSFRGNDVMRIAPRSMVTRRTYAALTAAADANLFCSPWLMRQATGASWFRGRTDRVGVLADAVDVSRRATPSLESGGPFVLAAGRMVHKKGFDLLLRGWAKVAAEVGAPLWLAGDGPEAESLRRLAAELGLGDRVRFVGPVPHPELLGLLERAALCVVPSREEPYGILVLEAQALGTPVVATAVGNIPELIESGSTGYLAAPTAEGLATAIAAAWRDDRRPEIGRAGRHAPGAVRGYDAMAQELEGWLAGTPGPVRGAAAWS
jgi:glycosyltransferase involved in cell wall biosynthesis